MNLRQLRERAALTQEQAAEITQLHQTTISQLETGGASDARYSTIKALAEAYHCSTDEIAAALARSVEEAAA